MRKEISIIIPALNEEKNIRLAIRNVVAALQGYVDDYEILVMNDGSSDRTGMIAEEEAGKNHRIRVIHNEENKGYGYSYRRALTLAAKTFVTTFSGDNDMSAVSLQNLINAIGTADVICNYYDPLTSNRSLFRKILSKLFVMFVNFTFGLNLKYSNGCCLCRVALLQKLDLKSEGLLINTEILVKLLKSGATYQEVPFEHIGGTGGKTSVLRWKTVRQTFQTLGCLVQEIYFPRRRSVSEKSAHPVKIP